MASRTADRQGLEALRRLEADGLVERDAAGILRTTRRWQGAMARAAVRLYNQGDPGEDLRTPVALAIIEVYGKDLPEDVLIERVVAMLPIEARALGPQR